jgi:micrococcal nuclease
MIKAFSLVVSLCFIALSSTFYGTVIGVTDGDTIVVLTDENKQVKVRLEGIDCPESSQDFGQRAKQSTVLLCFQKRVRINETGKDRYGRTLAFVYVGDTCINKELLRNGMAWHYKKYNQDPELAELENMAKKKKVGLWSQSSPIPPWDYRHK